MGLDKKAAVCFRVSRAPSGLWEVREEGVDKPLAAFEDRLEASEYANELANAREGSIVLIHNGDASVGA